MLLERWQRPPTFRNTDDAGDGVLTLDELVAGLKSLGVGMSAAEIETKFAHVDSDGNSLLDPSEVHSPPARVAGSRSDSSSGEAE